MTNRTEYVPVRLVRTLITNSNQWVTYTEATVAILGQGGADTAYLRINNGGNVVVSEELDVFQWLAQSSSEGVAAIDSRDMKIIIVYDAQSPAARALFVKMQALLRKNPTMPESHILASSSSQSPPMSLLTTVPSQEDHVGAATMDLLDFVRNGAVKDVEYPATYLSEARIDLEFRIIDSSENTSTSTVSQPTSQPPSNAFRLRLQIECHLDREPIKSTIHVPTGSKLRALKEQIEDQTRVRCRDQFWFAMDRYPIDDEYVFGSSDPVVPPLKRNASLKQEKAPTDPIRAGDTLILYIAQLPQYN